LRAILPKPAQSINSEGWLRHSGNGFTQDIQGATGKLFVDQIDGTNIIEAIQKQLYDSFLTLDQMLKEEKNIMHPFFFNPLFYRSFSNLEFGGRHYQMNWQMNWAATGLVNALNRV
jgi:hypothetical protein